MGDDDDDDDGDGDDITDLLGELGCDLEWAAATCDDVLLRLDRMGLEQGRIAGVLEDVLTEIRRCQAAIARETKR